MNHLDRRQRHEVRHAADLALLLIDKFPISQIGRLMDRNGVPFAVQCRLLMPYARPW